MLKTKFTKDTIVAFSNNGLSPAEFEGKQTLGELLEECDLFYPPMRMDPKNPRRMIPDDDPQAEWFAMNPYESSKTFRNCDLSDGVGEVTCCGVRYWTTKMENIKKGTDEWNAIFDTLNMDPFDLDCLNAILFLKPMLGLEDGDHDTFSGIVFSTNVEEFLAFANNYEVLQERLSEMTDKHVKKLLRY